MGHIVRTRAGTWRANWRDPTGRQRAKTFSTKRDASRFLAEIETTKVRGQYVDPSGGRVTFGEFARRWERARVVEATTSASTRSKLQSRLLPYWGRWLLAKIDHLAVQEWVNKMASELAPSSVASYHATFSTILSAATRARIIATNPCDGVRLPAQRRSDGASRSVDRAVVVDKLLPAVPKFYRALPATAACAGLRWGECLGLRWSDVDLTEHVLTVRRTLVEVRGAVTVKPYPKSQASQRTVPIAPFLLDALRAHRELTGADEDEPVFTGPDGGVLLRGNFRRRVWRPALVRSGLLGRVVALNNGSFLAFWHRQDGTKGSTELPSERAATEHVVRHAHGGLRFHDLSHCYATWLVSSGLPVNVVQKVMGHEQPSTTLNLYTHAPTDYYGAIRAALGADADFSLTRPGNSNRLTNDSEPVDPG
ncbi:MAG: tyrosine-type recombinase/integrase [Nocardioidaceae bacterium]